MRHAAYVCIVTCLAANPLSVQAQSPPLIFEPRPSDERPPLPDFEEQEPSPIQLPPIAPAPVEQPAMAASIMVREFKFSGNTVFSDQELSKITAAFEKREITNQELQQLRQQLTLYYVDRGYINSGNIIPDQKVVDGVILIQIVEGRLTQIEIDGVERFHEEYFRERLALDAGPPVNVNKLEQRLQILLQNPLVDQINSQLVPGNLPGEAVLRARVVESPPYTFHIGLDNNLSPSIGEAQLSIQGSYRNAAGRGDVLFAEASFAEGIDTPGDELTLNYNLPLSAGDIALNLYYNRGESKVVEGDFSDLDIESESETIGIGIFHPLYRNPNQQFTLGYTLERRRSDTFLLGFPFSFSPGTEDPAGESNVALLRFSQDWLSRSPNQVMAVRSTFSFGFDGFDATINDDPPDGEFLAWLIQYQWARRLGDAGNQVIFRADLQLSDDPLLPLEKFSVGGVGSVRGYRESQLVRDEGYSLSLEYRMPLSHVDSAGSNLQLSAFIDAGHAEDKELSNPGPDRLESVGLGVLWDPYPEFHVELYWAEALEDIDNGGDTLQDDGIHFNLVCQLL